MSEERRISCLSINVPVSASPLLDQVCCILSTIRSQTARAANGAGGPSAGITAAAAAEYYQKRGNRCVVPVAILSSPRFDATQVGPASVTLAGAKVSLIGKADKYACHSEDVNGDGLLDLVCKVVTAQFLIQTGDSVAVLEAETFNGEHIRGEDSIQIVP